MVTDNDFQKAAELINKSDNILITTHTRPDGDACGSVVTISDALAALGKRVKLMFLSPVPQRYELLFAALPDILGRDITSKQLIAGQFAEPDLIIVVDTNSYSQLPEFEQYLKDTDKPVLVIDHHITSDGLGDVELIDTSAAATALIVFDFLKYVNWPITDKMAQAFFVAIAADTGWFQFSNTDSRVFRSCSDLIDRGANPTEIYHDLCQNFSHQRFKLLAAMLNTLQLHLDGRFATQHLLQRDFEQTGAVYSDTENLIDQCQRIRTVEAAALFVELEDGRIRCSLRSRGAIDVRRIAEKFGGGGHAMAAGVHLPGPLEEAKKLIKTEIEKQFR